MNRVLVHLLERDVRGLAGGAHYEAVKADLLARRLDPYQAAARLLAGARSRGVGPPGRPGGPSATLAGLRPRPRSPSPPGPARSGWAGTTRTA